MNVRHQGFACGFVRSLCAGLDLRARQRGEHLLRREWDRAQPHAGRIYPHGIRHRGGHHSRGRLSDAPRLFVWPVDQVDLNLGISGNVRIG